MPFAREGGVLRVAVADPIAVDVLDSLSYVAGAPIQPALASAGDIRAARSVIFSASARRFGSSTMVAEGPAVKLFQSEQLFFSQEFTRLWCWVMEVAMQQSLLPGDFFERIEASWTFPQLVTRDRPRERAADARLVELGILSRAEVARRDGVEPDRMRAERKDETLTVSAHVPVAQPATSNNQHS